jgi:hypothetical protein
VREEAGLGVRGVVVVEDSGGVGVEH